MRSLSVFIRVPAAAAAALVLSGGAHAQTGGCCLPDTTCAVLTFPECSAQGGTYLGDGVACTECAACCFTGWLGYGCMITSAADCAGVDGVYVASCTQCCYANCDRGAVVPILNVQDFTCFLQRFAAGDIWANCDLTLQPPVLNVADFTCFVQKFAAGCP